MNRSVLVYGILLAAAMVASYVSWTSESRTGTDEGVTIATFEREALSRLSWKSDRESLTLEPREDERGRYLWARWEETPAESRNSESEAAASAKDNDTEEDSSKTTASKTSDSQKGSDEPTTREFKVGSAGDRLMEELVPLKAKRQLKEVDDDKLADFGLDEPKGPLTLELTSGDSWSFEVGDNSYGGEYAYVRQLDTGDIYLFDASAIRPLEGGLSRLEDSELFDVEADQIASIAVSTADKSVTLHHHHRDDRRAAFWALGDEKQKNQTGETWLDKFFRLRVRSYVGELPDAAKSAFIARIEPASDEPVEVEIFEVPGNGGEQGSYFARSDYTRAPVELYGRSASNVVDDLSTLFGAKSGSDRGSAKPEKALPK